MTTTVLTTHHVGGRAGTRTFPSLKYFEKDIISVLYEADESAISGIKKNTHHLPSKTIILPDCLSGHAGKRDFYIYNNRYLSIFISARDSVMTSMPKIRVLVPKLAVANLPRISV